MKEFTEKLKEKLMKKLPQDIDEIIRAKVSEKLTDFVTRFPGIVALALVSPIFIFVKPGDAVQNQDLQDFNTEPVITTETVYLDDVTSITKVEGSYIFGCGNVHETKYYEAHAIQEDGRRESFSMPADEIVVYETLSSKDQPYMEIDTRGAFTVETRLYLPSGYRDIDS